MRTQWQSTKKREDDFKTRDIQRAKKNIAKQSREARGCVRSRIRFPARDKATLTCGKASEKLVEAINRLEEKIGAFESQMVDREAEKKVTLSRCAALSRNHRSCSYL